MYYLDNKTPSPDTWDKVAENYQNDVNDSEINLANEIQKIFGELGVSTGSLLELGSGSGHLSGLLNKVGYNVSLVDFSKNALKQSEEFFQRHGLQGEFVYGDITNLDITELHKDEYDIVWNSGVLEHFSTDNLLSIFQMINSLKCKYFVFLVPNPDSLPYLLYRYKLIQENNWAYGKEYLREDYRELLEQCGFKDIQEIFLGEEYMVDHMNVAFENKADIFAELVHHNLVPKMNCYLKAYIAVPAENNTISKGKSIDIMEDPELKTYKFDMLAQLNGQNNKISEKEEIINRLQNEIKEYKNRLSFEKSQSDKEIESLESKLKETKEILSEAEKEKSELKASLNEINDSHSIEMNNISGELHELKTEVQTIQGELEEKNYEIAYANALIREREDTIDRIYNSRFWKVATKYYKFRDSSLLIKTLRTLKNEGLRSTIVKTKKKLKKEYIKIRYKNENLYQLKKIIKGHEGKEVIIFPPLLDWNIPLFQRPQHIALNLAKQGYLYFFCTSNHYDQISGFNLYAEDNSLYITDQYELLMKHIPQHKIMHFYAQDSNITRETIDSALSRQDTVLYEYLDALHEDLCTSKNNVIERHLSVMKNEKCIVISTADILYKEVAQYRNSNFELVTNGVEISHFKSVSTADIPHEIVEIKNKNKPIIGYFGALAKWFDYQLVIKLAKERPEYEILLIGWNYDGSLDQYNLDEYENITVIGPINYIELPKYAVHFDVSTIPFILNDITEATSPIKLFEYMALGHPIVTSNLPECRKYESVIVAKDHDSFIASIDKALDLRNDTDYNQVITNEALENTWESKAKNIAQLIKKMNN